MKKLEYEAPKHGRFKKPNIYKDRTKKTRVNVWFGVEVDGYWYSDCGKWWSSDKPNPYPRYAYYSGMWGVSGVRAFRRFLKKVNKQKIFPKGTKVVLCSRFSGCNVIGWTK